MVIPVEVKRHDPSTHYVLPSKVLPSVLRIVTRVYGATTGMMVDYYHLDEKV
jgi:hypothetical protein